MAKLSAHGTEVFRLTRVLPRKPDDVQTLTKNDQAVISIRSDLAVLKKVQIVRAAYSWESPGEKYIDLGWKLKYTRKQMLTKGFTNPAMIRDAFIKVGYTVDV